MMDSLLRLAALTLGAGGTTFFLWAAAISAREGEGFAVRRMLFLALLVPLPYFLAAFLPGQVGATGSGVLVGLTAAVLMGLLLPVSGGRIQELGVPVPGFDERDIMFSRAELVPGSDRFEEYYRTRPDKLELDKEFRRGPGLLSPGAVHFHRYGFAAADAAFWTIEMLRPFVDGEPEADGAAAQPPPEAVTRFLREWVLKMGAHSVGVTELRDYHLYSYAGRGRTTGRR